MVNRFVASLAQNSFTSREGFEGCGPLTGTHKVSVVSAVEGFSLLLTTPDLPLQL